MMHTQDSTAAEIAYSKLHASAAVAEQAAQAILDEDLELAAELLDKAGGKLHYAREELHRARHGERRSRFLGSLLRRS